MNNHTPGFLGILMTVPALVFAAKEASTTENKNITVLHAEGKLEGGAEVRREVVLDCLLGLPSPEGIEADVTAESKFLRGMNGEKGKDAWTKVYTARIELNYMNKVKELLIITPKSVQGQEPTIKEVEKQLKEHKVFVSNPEVGDTFAGRSNREYYFITSEDAVKDVKGRVKVWLSQQKAVMCPDK